jgi:hypothetical protein
VPPKRPLRIIAAEYHEMLNEARKNDWQVKCETSPDEFVLYDISPSKEVAKAMCAGCPMLVLCREQALATKPAWGVMGGIAWNNRRQNQPEDALPEIEIAA